MDSLVYGPSTAALYFILMTLYFCGCTIGGCFPWVLGFDDTVLLNVVLLLSSYTILCSS